jgi:hypothetical protein
LEQENYDLIAQVVVTTLGNSCHCYQLGQWLAAPLLVQDGACLNNFSYRKYWEVRDTAVSSVTSSLSPLSFRPKNTQLSALPSFIRYQGASEDIALRCIGEQEMITILVTNCEPKNFTRKQKCTFHIKICSVRSRRPALWKR